MTKGLFQRQMTRRTIVSGGLSCAMAWIIPSRLVSDFDLFEPAFRRSWNRKEVTRNGNLYAFPGARPESTVIAVTWQETRSRVINDRTKKSKLRIHAGSKSWDFMVGSRTATSEIVQDGDISVYISEILSPRELPPRMILKAAVITAPNRAIADRDSIGIWAERFESGLRERIGTPFLSTLVAGSDQLACIYHSCSPAEDRRLLMQPLAREIAARARARVADPEGHGRRLASALLPDVLHYDPNLPSGYTFASRNGRHPSESSTELVNTILGGAPSSKASEGVHHLKKHFPYFRQA
jgi:hypothetical protein